MSDLTKVVSDLRERGAINPKQAAILAELDRRNELRIEDVATAIGMTKQPQEMGGMERMGRAALASVPALAGLPGDIGRFAQGEVYGEGALDPHGMVLKSLQGLPSSDDVLQKIENATGVQLRTGDPDIYSRIGGFVGGGLAGGGPGLVRRGLAEGMGAAARGAAANVGGSAAAAIGAQAGSDYGPGGELVGALGVTGGLAGMQGLARGALRGFGIKNDTATREAYEMLTRDMGRATAGTIASDGIATPLERTLASVPGSIKFFRRQAEEFKSGAYRRLSGILKMTPSQMDHSLDELAGSVVQRLVSERVKAAKLGGLQMFARRDALIPPDARINFPKTREYLEKISGQALTDEQKLIRRPVVGKAQSDIPGLAQEKLDDLLFSPMMTADGLPYQEIDALRKATGQAMSSGGLLADNAVDAFNKGLYGALLDDLANGARQVGGQEAYAASRAAAAYWKAERALTDGPLARIKSKEPEIEKAFREVAAGNLRNTTTIRSALRELKSPEDSRILTAAWIAKVGRLADDGSEGMWNIDSFVKNWNKSSPIGRKEIMRGDPDMERAITDFAKSAALVDERSQVLRNVSGTAPVGMAAATLMSTFTALSKIAASGAGVGAAITGTTTGAIQGMAASFFGAGIAARLFTYKPFVKWLAYSSRGDVSQLPMHIMRLKEIAGRSNDPLEISDIYRFVSVMEAQAAQAEDKYALDDPKKLRESQ